MNESDIEKRIDAVFQSVLGNAVADYQKDSRPIESVMYVELLISFQNEFKIKFSTQEFFILRSVENIKNGVLEKIRNKKGP